MITERGAGLLIGSAFAWLMGRFLGVPELYVVACATLGLVILAVVAVWLSTTRLEVQRDLTPAQVAWGSRTLVTVRLRNNGRFGSGLVLVGDDVPFTLADAPRFAVPVLPRHHQAVLSYELAGVGRGRYGIGPARIRLRDPFGLAERVRLVGPTSTLIVYPRVVGLAAVPTAERRGEGGVRRRALLNSGDEFATIREWAPGDDVRMVHWPSSAHRSRLMVRQFEQPYEPLATLVCDTRAAVHVGVGSESTVETAVTAVASIAAHLHAHGHRLRVRLPDDTAKLTADDYDLIMDRLAVAAPSAASALAPTLAAVAGRTAGGLLVAALAPPRTNSPTAAADMEAIVAAGRGYSVRIALIVNTAGRLITDPPAHAMSTALHRAGWRTAVVQSVADVPDAWAQVAGQGALTLGGSR